MRDYGKIYNSFWSSPTTGRMSDDAKLLAIYLMTCSHNTIAGVFRLPDGYAAEDLGWTPERVSNGFVELSANGFANRCETTKWVVIHKHLDWNPPENPNQAKAAVKVMRKIPADCVWLPEFMRVSGELLGLDQHANTEPFRNPLETLSKPGTGTGTGTGAVAEIRTGTTSSPDGDPLRCPVNQIVTAYHDCMPNNPRCKVLTTARQKSIAARWREASTLNAFPFDGGYSTVADGVNAWREFFAVCAESEFLTGRSKPQPGKPPFLADIDFLFSPGGFAKCLENKYHRESA